MALVYPNQPDPGERDMGMTVQTDDGDFPLVFLYKFEQLDLLRDAPVGAVFIFDYVTITLGSADEPLEFHQRRRYRVTSAKAQRFTLECLDRSGPKTLELPIRQAPYATYLISSIRRGAGQRDGARLLTNPNLYPNVFDIDSWISFIEAGDLRVLVEQFKADLGVRPVLSGEQMPDAPAKTPTRTAVNQHIVAVMLGRALDEVRRVVSDLADATAVREYFQHPDRLFVTENMLTAVDTAVMTLFPERIESYWRAVREDTPRELAFQQAKPATGRAPAAAPTAPVKPNAPQGGNPAAGKTVP
jgi:hypothetical protein